jgi:hypothetical protein
MNNKFKHIFFAVSKIPKPSRRIFLSLYTLRLTLYALLIIFSLPFYLCAMPFSLADTLYTDSLYDLARIEYRREFFFYPELHNDPHKRLNYAVSLMWHDDVAGLQELDTIQHDFPELEPGLLTSIARTYLSAEEYAHAGEVLQRTDEKKLLGFVYLLDDRFVSARSTFATIGNHEIVNEISLVMNAPRKSARTATILSVICPGAGQMYAGNAGLGIKDFLLNFGSGYLVYNAVKQKKYVDAVLIFNFLFQRFYLGSIYNAQKVVEETNQRHQQQWLDYMHDKYFSDIDKPTYN